ncbi:MAG: thermonuclease family protein [Paracoccaceae bacterium]
MIPFSRSYRRSPRWGMGLPPRRPRRWRDRVLDPVVYLRAVIGFAALGLIVVPFLADGVLAVARPIAAGAGQCRVLRVVDGDTVTLWCAGGIERARLEGFDAPELFSPGCLGELVAAQKAKWVLRGHLLAEGVRLERGGLDRYARRLVTVWVGDAPLAQMMVEAGHARSYAGGTRGGWCE